MYPSHILLLVHHGSTKNHPTSTAATRAAAAPETLQTPRARSSSAALRPCDPAVPPPPLLPTLPLPPPPLPPPPPPPRQRAPWKCVATQSSTSSSAQSSLALPLIAVSPLQAGVVVCDAQMDNLSSRFAGLVFLSQRASAVVYMDGERRARGKEAGNCGHFSQSLSLLLDVSIQ
jgi:hypothetical protein